MTIENLKICNQLHEKIEMLQVHINDVILVQQQLDRFQRDGRPDTPQIHVYWEFTEDYAFFLQDELYNPVTFFPTYLTACRAKLIELEMAFKNL